MNTINRQDEAVITPEILNEAHEKMRSLSDSMTVAEKERRAAELRAKATDYAENSERAHRIAAAYFADRIFSR